MTTAAALEELQGADRMLAIARRFRTTPQDLTDAKWLKEHAPDFFEMVSRGEMAVSTAVRRARLATQRDRACRADFEAIDAAVAEANATGVEVDLAALPGLAWASSVLRHAEQEPMRPVKVPPPPVYMTSPIKRSRRTKADIEAIKRAIYAEARRGPDPVTVRYLFYRLVGLGLVDKTEAEYKGTIGRLTSDMRRAGELPWSWIVDASRWVTKPRTYTNLEDAMTSFAADYRRELWVNQGFHIEVWAEKETIASVLAKVTEKWDVPLAVFHGYASLTMLHNLAVGIAECGKACKVLYFGDHDPSGVDMERWCQKTVREFAPDADIEFRRLAVTEAQIRDWNLPTRPTKKSDSRSKNFRGESVELDTIEMPVLTSILDDAIEAYVDPAALSRTRVVEEDERRQLTMFAHRVRNGGSPA